MPAIQDLRKTYHRAICRQVIYLKAGNKPSMADVASSLSVELARGLVRRLGYPTSKTPVDGQTAGSLLEQITRDFLEEAFSLLRHLRPGQWQFSVHGNLADFDQYKHLAELADLVEANKELRIALGDYVIKPDILVSRQPVLDSEINRNQTIVNESDPPKHTPFRATNLSAPTLHASISCKWTLRSDRAQNARTEGLNLIRNRKGHAPHIAVITGEPLPNRIASLAMGTGDIDCVYHFALHELVEAANAIDNEAVTEMLDTLVQGRRLRDIADLPFDLAL